MIIADEILLIIIGQAIVNGFFWWMFTNSIRGSVAEAKSIASNFNSAVTRLTRGAAKSGGGDDGMMGIIGQVAGPVLANMMANQAQRGQLPPQLLPDQEES